jgi:hypothetical protein
MLADVTTQLAELPQQTTDLQSKVTMLCADNTTLTANNALLTTQVNAMQWQPLNVPVAGGTGNSVMFATPVQFATTPAMGRQKDTINYTTKFGTMI